jgi:flagellar hook-associated protein 1
MTIPTLTGLQTALSGLEASQAAIDTTGENISNANTPGYTRQIVNTVETPGLNVGGVMDESGAPTQLGTGVDVSSISRVRDQFLDVQYRAQNSLASAASTISQQLQNAQSAVGTSSTSGLQADMSAFWTAWSNLATNPSSSAAQQSVYDAGQTLVSNFQSVSGQMTTVSNQAQTQYNTLIGPNGQVQQDANQIATLNAQIVQANQDGQSPNSLLDQRDNLLDDLSGLAQVSVTPQTNGAVQVAFGGVSLISGTTGGTVTMPSAGSLTPSSGGELGALLSLTSSSGPIAQLQNSLDGVATTVANDVNGLQPSGSPFFSFNSSDPAASIAVAVSTPSAITATSSGSTTAGDLAQSIANLSGGAPDQAYAAFVAQVGDTVQSAENTQTTAQAVLSGISNQRQSVSGVSLDQEMANLINYQQAYQASARVMNAMNSAINSLITVAGAGL